METLSYYFDRINEMLGVKTPGDLLFHPVFIGLCIAIFLYAVFKGWKFFAVTIYFILAGGLVFHYLYPADSSQLDELMKFIGAMGVVGLLGIYFGFIRD